MFVFNIVYYETPSLLINTCCCLNHGNFRVFIFVSLSLFIESINSTSLNFARSALTPEQLACLEIHFSKNQDPKQHIENYLATELGVILKVIKVRIEK